MRAGFRQAVLAGLDAPLVSGEGDQAVAVVVVDNHLTAYKGRGEGARVIATDQGPTVDRVRRTPAGVVVLSVKVDQATADAVDAAGDRSDVLRAAIQAYLAGRVQGS